MIPTQENMIEIAQYVLSTMVQMETNPIQFRNKILLTKSPAAYKSAVMARAVVIQTTHRFASQAASVMLDQPEASLTDEDLRDTLAEITNMIGGNIKSQVPGLVPVHPFSHLRDDFDFSLKGASTLNSISLDCITNHFEFPSANATKNNRPVLGYLQPQFCGLSQICGWSYPCIGFQPIVA